jgi:anaerobic ribonucleoside-triphosphate reductase activating protein
MVKYYNAMVVFEEIPNEITLAINITNCPCHCKGCHSKFLWEDVGAFLTTDELDDLIEKNDGITTICFMGGDRNPGEISALAEYVHEVKHLKVGWYSGADELSDKINIEWFDFIKIGHYDEDFGGLNKKTTNQRFFKVSKFDNEYELVDMTSLFWKKEKSWINKS